MDALSTLTLTDHERQQVAAALDLAALIHHTMGGTDDVLIQTCELRARFLDGLPEVTA